MCCVYGLQGKHHSKGPCITSSCPNRDSLKVVLEVLPALPSVACKVASSKGCVGCIATATWIWLQITCNAYRQFKAAPFASMHCQLFRGDVPCSHLQPMNMTLSFATCEGHAKAVSRHCNHANSCNTNYEPQQACKLQNVLFQKDAIHASPHSSPLGRHQLHHAISSVMCRHSF